MSTVCLKVAIATTGRFHVLDLARTLAALGHEVAFYSYVPRQRAMQFGLPAECHRSLLPFLAPLVVLQRYGGTRLRRAIDLWLLAATDHLIAQRLEPCDVFISMSGLAVESAQVARERYGAKVFIERGSRHILSQKVILDDLGRRGMPVATVPDYAVERELAGYALADRVVVPSLHAEQSFLERGFPATKLFRNPYGVDLSMFPPTPAPATEQPTLLFVGGWSYRKGVDLLEAAWRRLEGVRLLHVGGLADAPLPKASGFVHMEPIPQWQLREYYAQAHLFILASREEGLALVQAQALASGLPLICTDRTGGEDLQRLLDDPSWVKVVPSDDVEALVAAIREMLPKALCLRGERDFLGKAREDLSWGAYGQRYALELERTVLSGKTC